MSSKTTSSNAAKSMINNVENALTRSVSLVSIDDAALIARHDGVSVSTTPDKYVDANKLTYYIAINTWLFQVMENGGCGHLDLLEAIQTRGLLEVIALCDGTANRYIHEMFSVDVPVNRMEIPMFLTNVLTHANDDQQALQWLRYLKRFSPDEADLVAKSSVDSFLAVNRGCKVRNRTEMSYYWVKRIRARIADMLAGYDVDWSDGLFSAGVAADARRPLMDKLEAYSQWDACLFHDSLYAIGFSPSTSHSDDYCAIVRPVPKTYKGARIIAMEHAYRQFHMQAIRKEIERLLQVNGYDKYLNLHDQTPNQVAAREGSYNPTYATIDLSSASDSIGRAFAYSVLPANVVHDVDEYLAKEFIAPSKDSNRRVMHMFSTSGSAVCFPVESVIFLAICIEVTETCTSLTGEHYVDPIVFGDDMLVDVQVYDTMCDVLTQLGFTVNLTKSYGDLSRYRESCGVEYVDGYNLQSTYWPRAIVSWHRKHVATTVSQLCSLQHALFGNQRARFFLAAVVRILEPRMTSHAPYTDCQDLWEYSPRFVPAHAPIEGGIEALSPSVITSNAAVREKHLTLKTRRDGSKISRSKAGLFPSSYIVDMWLYTTFLLHGPTYADKLDQLLGVSSKPPTRAMCADTGQVYWDWIRE